MSALCSSHLLFGAVVWAPALPTIPTLRPARTDPVGHPLQTAYNSLLRWALGVPVSTRLELLHLLANLPPPGVLIAKQLVRYVAGLGFAGAPGHPSGPGLA